MRLLCIDEPSEIIRSVMCDEKKNQGPGTRDTAATRSHKLKPLGVGMRPEATKQPAFAYRVPTGNEAVSN
jgi:hypothetical protein